MFSRSIFCIFIQDKKYELIHKNIVSQHKVLIYFKHFSSISLNFICDYFSPRYCTLRNSKCSEEHFITFNGSGIDRAEML